MVDRYWRQIESVENNIENAMQISSVLLKLKGYDDDLGKIEDNENNISSNLSNLSNMEIDIEKDIYKKNLVYINLQQLLIIKQYLI